MSDRLRIRLTVDNAGESIVGNGIDFYVELERGTDVGHDELCDELKRRLNADWPEDGRERIVYGAAPLRLVKPEPMRCSECRRPLFGDNCCSCGLRSP